MPWTALRRASTRCLAKGYRQGSPTHDANAAVATNRLERGSVHPARIDRCRADLRTWRPPLPQNSLGPSLLLPRKVGCDGRHNFGVLGQRYRHKAFPPEGKSSPQIAARGVAPGIGAIVPTVRDPMIGRVFSDPTKAVFNASRNPVICITVLIAGRAYERAGVRWAAAKFPPFTKAQCDRRRA